MAESVRQLQPPATFCYRHAPQWVKGRIDEGRLLKRDVRDILKAKLIEIVRDEFQEIALGKRNEFTMIPENRGGVSNNSSVEYLVLRPSKFVESEDRAPIDGVVFTYVDYSYYFPWMPEDGKLPRNADPPKHDITIPIEASAPFNKQNLIFARVWISNDGSQIRLMNSQLLEGDERTEIGELKEKGTKKELESQTRCQSIVEQTRELFERKLSDTPQEYGLGEVNAVLSALWGKVKMFKPLSDQA